MGTYKSDIEIAQEAELFHINEVAAQLGLSEDDIEHYGKYKAKISLDVLNRPDKKNAKLILVTAITPTPAGEGKSTISVGLTQGLNKIGRQCTVALREPSLGPCFGVKGGAAGGGYSQVVPMEDINLHFTGDLHAITTAHNLLSAVIDNHIKQGNWLGFDTTKIVWKRALDMNDRALRSIVVGLGGTENGTPREDGFIITVASEVMAIMCLSNSLAELKEKFGQIVVGYTTSGKPIRARELKVHGAMAALMKDALKPNLVQTIENTPAIIHGGPFANIAHGCNSVLATKVALKLSDYVVTEAGFGADLGAEKFFDIKCRLSGITPDCVVIVATARALKMHGGVSKADLNHENLPAIKAGFVNLEKHIENVKKFGVPVVVAINYFPADTHAEHLLIQELCAKKGVKAEIAEIWAKGGEGGKSLAEAVVYAIENEDSCFAPLYDENLSVKEKIEIIAKEIYGADSVLYSKACEKEIRALSENGFDRMPICIAKTQYSFSDDPTLLGRPKGFSITIRSINVSAGAGFLVALAGDIMTMPGLPKIPAVEKIDVDDNGKITGLF